MPDIFGREKQDVLLPMTTDNAKITIGNEIVYAQNVQITYTQDVQRRRVIGGKGALLIPGQPRGQMSIGIVMVAVNSANDSANGRGLSPGSPEELWSSCESGGSIQVEFGAGPCGATGSKGKVYKLTGALVTQYGVSMEAEGMLIQENVVIDFLQLEVT